MTKTCVFCKNLEEWKEADRFCRLDAMAKGRDYRHEYTAALLIRSWYADKGKRRASRTLDTKRGIGYRLNYCPECGRFLRRRT